MLPDPDCQVERLAVADFLQQQASHLHIDGYRDLLGLVPEFNAVLLRSFPAVDGIPELRISTSGDVDCWRRLQIEPPHRPQNAPAETGARSTGMRTPRARAWLTRSSAQGQGLAQSDVGGNTSRLQKASTLRAGS